MLAAVVFFLAQTSVGAVSAAPEIRALDPFDPAAGTAARLRLVAAKGEIESGRFVVRTAQEPLQNANFQVGALSSDSHQLSAGSVELRYLKSWYQGATSAARAIEASPQRVLTPELLVKDDELLRVDHGSKDNYVRVQAPGRDPTYVRVSDSSPRELNVFTSTAEFPVRDTQELTSFSLAARSEKHLWVTLRVPPDAAAGTYTGSIEVREGGRVAATLPVEVRVLPFALEPPGLEYSIYYRSQLRVAGGTISAEYKNKVQYEAELRDLREHGIANPTLLQPLEREGDFERALSLRRAAGFSNDVLYYLGFNTGRGADGAALKTLESRLLSLRRNTRRAAVRELYIYGLEEKLGAELQNQRANWSLVHAAGARIFMAGYEGTFDAVGDVLDLYIAKSVSAAKADAAHAKGQRIFVHKPQGGIEAPLLYRSAYGIRLWAAGYDGAMPFAYQAGFGSIWNDFDRRDYRDHNFTYPTADGVLDTMQWEGFREAVDDVRYLKTLGCAIARQPQAPAAQEAARFLAELKSRPDAPAAQTRAQTIAQLDKLTGCSP